MSGEAVKERVVLTETERQQIARVYYEHRKANPNSPIKDALRAARMSLPEDRRFSEQYSGVGQFTWLPGYLKALEKTQEKALKANGKSRYYYTEEERQHIALFCFNKRQENPKLSANKILKELRDTLPEDKKFNKQCHSFHQLTWLPPLMEALEKGTSQVPLLKEKQRPIIDGRQHLQTKIDTPAPAKKQKPQKTKVFLDHEERMIFAEQVYLIQKQFPGIEWKYVLKKANEHLPEDRRVGKSSAQASLKWLDKYKAMVVKKLADEAAKPVPVEVVPASAPVAEPANPLGDFMVQMMQKVAMEAMAKAISNGSFPIGMPGIPAVPATPVKAAEIHRKKVLIVGMLPHLGAPIQREFSRYLDITFFGADVTSEKIKDKAKYSDYAILMTKFVSHSTMNAMRGHENFSFCNGTETALHHKLAEIVTKEKA